MASSLAQSITDLHDRYEICIARGAQRWYRVTVQTIVTNPATLVQSLERTNLTGALVEFAVKPSRDAADLAVLFAKTSDTPGEIDIEPQVVDDVDQPTKGQAIIKILDNNTDVLVPGTEYVYDVWVTLTDGKRDAVIDESPFRVEQRITPITVA